MPGNGSAAVGELVVLAWGDDAGDPSILQQCRLGLDSDLRAALPEGLARVSIMGWVSIMGVSQLCYSLSYVLGPAPRASRDHHSTLYLPEGSASLSLPFSRWGAAPGVQLCPGAHRWGAHR